MRLNVIFKSMLVAVAFISLAVPPIIAQQALTTDDPDTVALIEWTKSTSKLPQGKPRPFLLGALSRAFGFADADIPMTQKGFVNQSTRRGYAFAILDNGELVMYRIQDDDTTSWHIARSGNIIRTLRSNPKSVVVVPNSEYLDEFHETKNFLLDRMRKEQQ